MTPPSNTWVFLKELKEDIDRTPLSVGQVEQHLIRLIEILMEKEERVVQVKVDPRGWHGIEGSTGK